MEIKYILRALLCIQQVSGRVMTRDDTSLANVEHKIPGEFCSLSAERRDIAGRTGETELDDDCDEVLNELSESDDGIDEDDLAKLISGDYSDIVCDLMLVAVLAKYKNYAKPNFGRRAEASDYDCQIASIIVNSYLVENQIEPPGTTSPENGAELAEVFWVRINSIDGEDPGDLYGHITATDDQGMQVLYNKDRANDDSIKPGDQVFLTGPPRSISAADGFTIDLKLFDKDVDPSPDDKVSIGQISWKHGDVHDAVQETNVTGGPDGSATVNYVVMSKAAQAKIDVILINGSDEEVASIYGSIKASTRFGQRQLFRKNDPYHTAIEPAGSSYLYVEIAPKQKLPLTRSTMAVPMDDLLIIDVDLWDYDEWSPNDKVAQGKIELIPEVGTSQKELVGGQDGEVEIRVTWS